jgi:hypothetical protein
MLLARHRAVLPWLIYLGFWISLTALVNHWLDPGVFAGGRPGVVGEQEICQAVASVLFPALAYSMFILFLLLLAHPQTALPTLGLVLLSASARVVSRLLGVTFRDAPPITGPSFVPDPIWPIAAVVGLALTLGLQFVLVEKAFLTSLRMRNQVRDRRRRPQVVASAFVAGSSRRSDSERDRTRAFRNRPRGLLGAGWFYYRQQVDAAIIECRTWGCLGLLIVATAMMATAFLAIQPDLAATTIFSRDLLIAGGFAFVMVGCGPWFLPYPVRLFLWGVPFRRQLYVRLASSGLDPVFFLFFLGALVLAVVDWSWTTPTVLLILGFKLFKTGLLEWPYLLFHVSSDPSPAPNFCPRAPASFSMRLWMSFRDVLPVLSVVGAIFGVEFALCSGGATIRPNDPFWGVGVLHGGVMIVLGLAGVLYKLLALDENWLRQHSVQLGEMRRGGPIYIRFAWQPRPLFFAASSLQARRRS